VNGRRGRAGCDEVPVAVTCPCIVGDRGERGFEGGNDMCMGGIELSAVVERKQELPMLVEEGCDASREFVLEAGLEIVVSHGVGEEV
jgi:hypothetical protein